METYTDPGTGRPYAADPVTGRTYWLDQPIPPNLDSTQELPVLADAPADSRERRLPRPVPPPRRRGVLGRVIGGLVVGLAALFGLMLLISWPRGADGAGAASPSTAAPRPARPAAASTPRAGTPVRDGDLEFTVTGTRTARTLGNGLFRTTADGRFLLVTVRVKNIADGDKTFLWLLQKMYDTQDHEHAADLKAAAFLGSPGNLVDRIAPADTFEATLVFDLPDGARADRVELHDGPLSGGATVRLR